MTAARYAQDTNVSVEASRNEIERTLIRYGATSFGYLTEPKSARVAFALNGRHIRFHLPLPARDADEFVFATFGARGKQPRGERAALNAWEQACRQRWRALLLIIKAKLEAVAAGITTVEDEFLAHTVLPDGRTVGEWTKPQLEQAYLTGKMPTSLMIEGPKP
jgi:hypothetical protein